MNTPSLFLSIGYSIRCVPNRNGILSVADFDGVTVVLLGRLEEDIKDILCIGLDVPREALKHFRHRDAGFFWGVFKEDGVSVSNLNKVVPAATRVSLRPVFGTSWLHRNARRVRRNAEAVRSASLRMASMTVAPRVPPSCSIHRQMVPLSMGTPSRSSCCSIRKRGGLEVLRDEQIGQQRRGCQAPDS